MQLDEKVDELINAYVEACRAAVEELVKEAGEEHLLKAWRSGQLPGSGDLSNGFSYRFHGVGCYTKWNGLVADFDFGPEGKVGGFDLYRLSLFQESREPRLSELELREGFQLLEQSGRIRKLGLSPSPHLYYRSSEE